MFDSCTEGRQGKGAGAVCWDRDRKTWTSEEVTNEIKNRKIYFHSCAVVAWWYWIIYLEFTVRASSSSSNFVCFYYFSLGSIFFGLAYTPTAYRTVHIVMRIVCAIYRLLRWQKRDDSRSWCHCIIRFGLQTWQIMCEQRHSRRLSDALWGIFGGISYSFCFFFSFLFHLLVMFHSPAVPTRLTPTTDRRSAQIENNWK